MSTADYRFETHWRVRASPELITEILRDPVDLPRWWPQVYIKVEEIAPAVYRLLTRGRLPYRLRWNFRVTESRAPYGFTIAAWGDLEGQGVWTFQRDGEFTDVGYLWAVQARKPLLRWFSFVLRPLFTANHRWAMARGKESLLREIARRKNLSL